MNAQASGNLPQQVITIQLAVRAEPQIMDVLRDVLDSKRVRDQIEMEVESVLLFEVANELETETPENIDVEWVVGGRASDGA
jgi:predicted P-loop ATPase/GTPase